jgi:hypothetical protein
MMLSPFPRIDFLEPRCPQFPVSVSPRLRTTLELCDFRGAEPSPSYRRLTQIRIDNLFSLNNPIFRGLPKHTLPGLRFALLNSYDLSSPRKRETAEP